MTKHLSIITGLGALLLSAGVASAGGSKGSIGVGGEIQLNGTLGGLSMNYDLGEFHVGGFFGFSDDGDDDDTDVAIGGRFYYHIHSSAMADFGIGGQVGLGFIGDRQPNADNNLTLIYLEPGLQMRAFIASNVALSFTGGITLGVSDAKGVAVTAQPVALAGAHYYFF